jgi:hypothetical protein
MKYLLRRVLAIAGLAGMILLIVPAVGRAEVRRIHLDVTGYLCGL